MEDCQIAQPTAHPKPKFWTVYFLAQHYHPPLTSISQGKDRWYQNE